MQRLFCLLFIGALSLGLTACSDVKKEMDRAEAIKREFSVLDREMLAMGIPNSSWSDEKLNSYEAKLDRMDALYWEGFNNNYIRVANNVQAVLMARRRVLEKARADKLRANGSRSDVDIVRSQKIERYNYLELIATANKQELSAMGSINDYTTIQQLEGRKVLLNDLRSVVREQLELLNELGTSIPEASKKRSDHQQDLEVIELELQMVEANIVKLMREEPGLEAGSNGAPEAPVERAGEGEGVEFPLEFEVQTLVGGADIAA